MSNYNKSIDRFDRMFLYFIDKIISDLPKPKRKFYIDIVYGILKSKSIILSNIAHELNETILLKKVIERLSNYLEEEIGTSTQLLFYESNLSLMDKTLKHFIVDDTDITKPYGKHFESLGVVKDGSAINTTFEKGYRVTTIVGLTRDCKHPIPFYDFIHSEKHKKFNSTNEYTLKGLTSIMNHLKENEGIFTFDRGYDDSKLIKFFCEKKQYFVIRLTKKRKIIIKSKKNKLIDVALKKKGKIVIPITYKSEQLEAKASHMKINLINFKEQFYVIFNYIGNANEPLMLLTNKPIKSKEDVILIVLNYCSRWKIEEYFRFKKVEFEFENFRVRSLNKINHLTFCLGIAISFMSYLIENKSEIYFKILSMGKNLKGEDAYLKFYQLISGIKALLGHKEKGIKSKQKIEHREKYKQLTLF